MTGLGADNKPATAAGKGRCGWWPWPVRSGRCPAQAAINWVRQQPGNIIPILGCRTVKQLQDNLGALEFRLTDEQMASLAALAKFNPGFPNGFLHSEHVRGLIFGTSFERLDQFRAG